MIDSEEAVLNLLGEAWNAFNRLPVLHPCDQQEFMTAIHAAQNIILARAGLRAQWPPDGIRPEVANKL